MSGYEHPVVAQLLRQFNTEYKETPPEDVAYVLGLLLAATRDPVLLRDIHAPYFRRDPNGYSEVCFWDGVYIRVDVRIWSTEGFVNHCGIVRAARDYCAAFELAVTDDADPSTLESAAQPLTGDTILSEIPGMRAAVEAYSMSRVGFLDRLPRLRWAPYVALYCGTKKALGEEPRFRQADENAQVAGFAPAQEQSC